MLKKISLVIGVLLVLAAGQSYAQVFPSVQLLSFDPATSTYVYNVTSPANSTYPFGYFQVDTLMACPPAPNQWFMQGAVVGGVDKLWPKGVFKWDPAGKDSAYWDPISRGMVIAAGTYWSGDFVLIVPNSIPTPGIAVTKDGVAGSYKVHSILVPGPKPSDITPPVTTITAEGTKVGDWFSSPVTITLSATDADGEVSLTEYTWDQWSWTLYSEPFEVTDEGVFNLFARSKDNSDNLEDPPVQMPLQIDTSAPLISGAPATTPNEKGWYSADVQINYTAIDYISGLAAPSEAAPGVELTFTHAVSSEGSSQSDSGTATDLAGNVGTANVVGLKIDKTAPVVTIGSPADGQLYGPSVAVGFGAADSLSGIDTLTGDVDGTVVSGGTALSLESGTHVLTVTAIDNAGNETTQTSSFTVDATPPVINIAAPVTDTLYGPSVPIQFDATDALSSVTSLTADVDGTAVTSGASVTLGSGSHTLTVVAVDTFGNTATQKSTFTVDTDPPEINIAAPVAGTLYGPSVAVQFDATDALSSVASLTADVDGTAVTSGASVTLAGGSHTLTVVAVDTFGNTATQAVMFNVDADAPVINIAAPVAGTLYGPSVAVAFTATDALSSVAGLTADVDGAPVTSGSSVTLGSGSHTLTVVAVDTFGNMATQKSTFTVDATPPVVTIQSPVADAVFKDTRCPVPVAYTVTDNMDAHPKTSVLLDGQPFTGTSLVLANLTFGDHTLTVIATDALGNTATASSDFKVVSECLKLFDVDHVDIDWVNYRCSNKWSKRASKISVSGELDLPGNYTSAQLTGEVIIMIEIGGREGTDTVLMGYKGRCGLRWNSNEQRYETPTGLNLDVRRATVQWSRVPNKPDKFSFVGTLDHGVFNDETGIITVTLTLPVKSGGTLSGTEQVQCQVKRDLDWHYAAR